MPMRRHLPASTLKARSIIRWRTSRSWVERPSKSCSRKNLPRRICAAWLNTSLKSMTGPFLSGGIRLDCGGADFFRWSMIRLSSNAGIGTSCHFCDYTACQFLTRPEFHAQILSRIPGRNVSSGMTVLINKVMRWDFPLIMRCHHCES